MEALTSPSDDGEHGYSGVLKVLHQLRCGGVGISNRPSPFRLRLKSYFISNFIPPSLADSLSLILLPILLHKSSLFSHTQKIIPRQETQAAIYLMQIFIGKRTVGGF